MTGLPVTIKTDILRRNFNEIKAILYLPAFNFKEYIPLQHLLRK